MRKNTLALFTLTLVLLGALSGLAQAGPEPTYECDELQEALTLSDPGEVITVAEGEVCTEPTFQLPSHQITLQGAGSGDTRPILDGSEAGDGGAGRIMQGTDVEGTTIRNLRFRNGDTGDDGGAIYLDGNSFPTIEGNDFDTNEADDNGGAVAIETFLPVRGANGEAINISDNVFEDGDAIDRAAGLYVDTHFPLIIRGNDFFDNAVSDGTGGGLYAISGEQLTLDDNVFEGNSATARGGGATARLCSADEEQVATVTNNVFLENFIHEPEPEPEPEPPSARESGQPPFGAGLHLADTCDFQSKGPPPGDEYEVHQSGNDFIGNVIEARPFENQSGSPRAPGGGGGEAIQGLATQSTSDYFFDNEVNRDGGEGGGLFVETFLGEPFDGRNLVAAANHIFAEPFIEERGPAEERDPAGEGGGIYFGSIEAPAELRLFNSTIVDNEAITGSAIDGGPCDELILHNGIVYGNPFHDGDEIDGFFFGTPRCNEQTERVADNPGTRDVQYTDICVSGEGGQVPHAGAGNICADPLLTEATDDSAPRQTSGSPTINKGSNALVPGDLSADFFGDARISGPSVDMGHHEVQEPTPTTTLTPAAEGCLNSQGGVRGRRLGPVLLGRRRAAQRQVMLGARLLTRFGMDKYCVTGGGLFRIGYPTARINRTIGRSLRRAVADRVVIALTSSPRFNVSGIVPSQTSASAARRRLRGERRFVIGRNTWLVTGAPRPVRRAQAGTMRLIKIQRGRVREVGIGDRRLARGDRRQLKRYLKTWQALGF
ncbi:MAG TPA: right-handed parallel beta-helix repeat-containing protein [Thermoleophilaceae bacterium]|nr:right-handed parallel beta-helix repeat-containing protein [Thermoleophilaceae bacterium]